MADISKRLEKADKFLQKGKPESALEEYLAAIDEDPNNDTVKQTAADLCVTVGRPRDAIPLLSTLLEKFGNDAAKGTVLYKKLARIATPTVDQNYRYAQLIERTSKREALELLRTASRAFEGSKRDKDAAAALKRVVLLDPTVEDYHHLGELLIKLSDHIGAAAAYLEGGQLAVKSGHDGAEYFAYAYHQDPTNHEAAYEHAKCLLAKGDAATAIGIVEPLATLEQESHSHPEFRELYGQVLVAAGRPVDAAPYILELYQKDPKQLENLGSIIAKLIDTEKSDQALQLAHKVEEHENKAGKRREFVSFLKDITDKHHPDAEFLEYLVELFNSANREGDYCQTLIKLFEIYYAQGNFIKAGDSLDRAAEVDPYEKGHKKRLEMLRGKLDANRFNAIANRFAAAGPVDEAGAPAQAKTEDSEPTVLEDFILQAEIFLQYGMRSKALERLERINKLFPHEEEKNEKLHNLYANAGMVPKYAAAPTTAAPAAAPAAPAAPAAGVVSSTAPTTPTHDESAVDNIARVTEITRNIYRQANVKSVLFTAVNDIGRHWSASRCIAGLCTPGKPPSAALEYCAPGVKQSDVMAIVKLIGTLQNLAVARGVVSIPDAKNSPDLAPIKQFIVALEIDSVLAVPLIDGDEQVGILILEQCGLKREWRQTDVVVLKTIADQTVLAVNNAKLRSLMKNLAVTEEKSGLLKRSSYLDVLIGEARRALQQSSTSTVMLLHFGRAREMVKEIGEPGVETLIQQIGQNISGHIRQNDVAVRYELTTIALILADTNDKNAFFVVDKLRKVIAGMKVPISEKPVTMTVGIAEAVMQSRFDPLDIVTEVINRVESALEAAKAEGVGTAKSLAPQLEAAAVA